MNNAPKLSIVVPIYNVEKYLRKGLDSIFHGLRGLDAIEVICVIDGSPDRSGEIVEIYSNRYSNVRCVFKENGGLSSARNAGIDVAKGDWITFFDPDDAYVDGAIGYLLDTISKTTADVIRFGMTKVCDQGVSIELNPAAIKNFNMNCKAESINLVKNVYIGSCNACFKRELVGGMRYVDGLATSEDAVWGLDVLQVANAIEVHDTILYKYNQREGSILHVVNDRRIRGNVDAALLIMERAKRLRFYDALKNTMFRRARLLSIEGAVSLILKYRDNKEGLWKYYFDNLFESYTGGSYVPPIERPIYYLSFRFRSKVLLVLLIYYPYVFMKKIIGSECLVKLWRKIR